MPSQPLSSTSGQKIHLIGYIVRQMRFSTHGAAVRFILSGPYDRLCEFSIDGDVTLRQVMLSYGDRDTRLIVIINQQARQIYGHYLLDLTAEYGRDDVAP